MSIKCNKPQVNALRKRVEDKVGYQALTHTSFISLSYDIEQLTHNHISESTLERLWGYSTRRADVVSMHTLNVLSMAVGMQTWNDFCRHLAEDSEVESDVITGNILDSDSLRIGGLIRIGWFPDRCCVCKYLGGHRFIVEQSANTRIQPGDNSLRYFPKNDRNPESASRRTEISGNQNDPGNPVQRYQGPSSCQADK